MTRNRPTDREGVPVPSQVSVQVEGRQLSLSNLDKVLYPDAGFTKAEVIDYYTRIAPVMLPHLAERAATRIRFPNGVGVASFFEKNAPSHTPAWVPTVTLPVPGSSRNRETIDYVVVDSLPTLVWLANLAALELHVPQWRVKGNYDKATEGPTDLVVFDLDPGAPATIVECAQVALMLRELLAEDGLDAYPKTSGSKGMQVYAAIAPTTSEATVEYSRKVGQRLATGHPNLVTIQMAKNVRPHKIFIDWSQNNAAKTTIAPFSLRAREQPTVSTPLDWAEVEACRTPADLRFVAREVLDRVEDHGDLFEPLLIKKRPALPR